MAALEITAINIYPVKSLGGIPVETGVVMKKGLQHDRRWMLIDHDNIFLTQRIHTKMALFRMSFGDNGFNVSFGGEQIQIPHTIDGDEIRSKVWDDEVIVREVSLRHSEWFSKNLGLAVRLVAFPENNERPVDPKYRVGDDHVSLADAYPLLIVGQRSLDDLNDRLKSPVPMNRFRPNIVFTGGEPYEEDTWSRFTMGELMFAGVKPSKRCVMITIDQETGSKGPEPTATLAQYRRRDNGVYFGQNVIPTDIGKISIGDEIIIHSSVDAHTFQ